MHESPARPRIVVTGGAGFIGSHLVERLVDTEAGDIVVVDDLSSGSKSNLDRVSDQITLVEDDIRSPSTADEVAEVEVVFHLAVRNVRASISHPTENFEVNADGTLRLLEAMRHAGGHGRFVYVSSSEVYGIPTAGEFREDTLPSPTTVYGAGKLAGELITSAYHRTYGMNTRIVRPFNNYGPRSHFEGDSGEVIPKFILRALAGRPLIVHGSGNQTRDFMFVGDTAHWLCEIAEIDELVGDIVNIGSGIELSVNDLAQLIITVTGSSSTVEHVDPRPGDLPRLQADTAKIQAISRFSLATNFESGLRQTVAFFADQDVERLLAAEEEPFWT